MNRLYIACFLLLSCFSAQAQEHFYDFIIRGKGADHTPIYGNDQFALFTSGYHNGGSSLYRTDGTQQGTYVLVESTRSVQGYNGFFEFDNLTYFSINNTAGNEIWRTDGTKGGTKKLHTLQGLWSGSTEMVVRGKDIYFYQQMSSDSFYIIRSDTSFSKPQIAARFETDRSPASNLVATDGYVFIAVYNKIYRVDANNNTVLYFEKTGSVSAGISDLYAHNNAVIWHMREPNSQTMIYAGKESVGSHKEVEKLNDYIYFRDHEGVGKYFYYSEAGYKGNPQLHRLDTEKLTQEDVGSTSDPYVGQKCFEMVAFNGQLYFQGIVSGDVELWKTGSSNASTALVKDTDTDTSGRPETMVVAGNKLYFSAYTRKNGRELWVTDGSTSGTQLAADVHEGPESSEMGTVMAPLGNSVISPAYSHAYGRELWLSNGNEKGTQLLSELNPTIDYGNQQVRDFITIGDQLFFHANDSMHGAELWVTEGTEQSTQFLDNINVSILPSEFTEYIEYKGQLYGTAFSFSEGVELYKSDGTPEGSGYVTPSDLFSSSAPQDYCILNESLYFIASTGLLGNNTLFTSDGTKAGTKTVNNGDKKAFDLVENLIEYKEQLYFGGATTDAGLEPFVSNGTKVGSTRILDFNPGSGSSHPNHFTGIGNKVFFSATKNSLWYLLEYDITTETLVEHPLSTLGLSGNEAPDSILSYDSTLIVLAKDANGKRKVYAFNALTNQLDLLESSTDGYEDAFAIGILNGRFLFSAQHQSKGYELFSTNGTAEGTRLLADIHAGSADAQPREFIWIKNKVAFIADGAEGAEIWISQGTPASTQRHIEAGMEPGHLGYMNGYVYMNGSKEGRKNSLYRFIIDSCDLVNARVLSSNEKLGLCQGDTLTLSASGDLTGKNLQWLQNEVSFDVTESIRVHQSGNYQLILRTPSCADTSEIVTVIDAPHPVMTASFETDSTFCEGQRITLVAQGDTKVNVAWYLGTDQYSSTRRTSIGEGGDFYAVGTNDFGCMDTSRTLTAIMFEKPKPEIFFINDTLWTADGASSYQWFLNNLRVDGATQHFLVPEEEGNYRVRVSNENDCRGDSENFLYDPTSIEGSTEAYGVQVFPNPFTSSTQIAYTLQAEQLVLIEVFNANGKKVETLVDNVQSAGSHQVRFSSEIPGLYLLRMTVDGNPMQRRLMRL